MKGIPQIWRVSKKILRVTSIIWCLRDLVEQLFAGDAVNVMHLSEREGSNVFQKYSKLVLKFAGAEFDLADDLGLQYNRI